MSIKSEIRSRYREASAIFDKKKIYQNYIIKKKLVSEYYSQNNPGYDKLENELVHRRNSLLNGISSSASSLRTLALSICLGIITYALTTIVYGDLTEESGSILGIIYSLIEVINQSASKGISFFDLAYPALISCLLIAGLFILVLFTMGLLIFLISKIYKPNTLDDRLCEFEVGVIDEILENRYSGGELIKYEGNKVDMKFFKTSKGEILLAGFYICVILGALAVFFNNLMLLIKGSLIILIIVCLLFLLNLSIFKKIFPSLDNLFKE